MLLSTLFLAGRVQGGKNNAGWSKESINEVRDKRRIQKEFMAAMHANDPKIGKGRRKGRDKKRKLYESLLSHARKLEENNNGGQQQDIEGEYGTWSWVLNGDGQYQDQYEGQYQGGWCETYQEEWAAKGQGEWTSNGQRRAEDANAQDGNNNNNNEQNMYGENNDMPFDMAAKAFKYSGCAAIKEFDNENAEESGNPFVLNTYAVFRLCPAESCNKYSMTGCGKNYGEYVVEMKTYLSSILDYYEYRYEDYCCYCETCDWEYQYEAMNALQECYDLRNDQEWQMDKQQQQTSWYDYYLANSGDMSGYSNGYSGSTTSAQSQRQYTSGTGEYQYANANYYNNADQDNDAYNQEEEATNGNTGYSNNRNSYNSQQNGHGQNWNGNYAADANNNNGASYNGNKNHGGYYSQNKNYNVNYQANNENEDDDQAMQNGKGYWGNDGIWYAYNGDDYQDSNNNMDMYQCIDGSMCDQCEYQNEQLYMPCDSYECGDYYKYCSEWYGDQDEVNVSDFLECVQFDSEDGQEYYIGPHCGSDHYTISLGVFSDENCLNYAGETMSLASLLGYQYKDEDLFKIPKECVSCDGTVSESMIRLPNFTMLLEDDSSH
jgi:hypothetical protein